MMRKLIFVMAMILWSGIVCAKNYSTIDAYVLKAPQAKSKDDMKTLVEYLVKPYHNDTEKARSIYAWIVNNVDYDAYKASLIENERLKSRLEQLPPPEHILKTRVGVCEDIANLYQEMGSLAGLNIQTISGWANTNATKRKKQEIGHVWNAVKIADTWSFVDPTWALSETSRPVFEDVYGNARYQTELKKRISNKKNYNSRPKRYVKDTWFMVSNDEMIKTHFPEEEQWQLQEKKMTKDEFFGRKANKRGNK